MSCMPFAIMYIFLCLICAFASFLSGYLFGKFRSVRHNGTVRTELDEKASSELRKRQKEYENFMNYDGSRQ